ncbi:MAG: hypothetical protein HC899_39880 [Leptolyngbyaceae cyanobacterium SM1_4_3]|nr:hypothetical protein [Leptolyngbyaceae cyanobacterium SM1_4_3]NJO67129.1 hypothetical protein [Leptolyngbyaceae cyanobacterium RM1_405_57]
MRNTRVFDAAALPLKCSRPFERTKEKGQKREEDGGDRPLSPLRQI